MVGVVRVAKLIITVFLDNYQLCSVMIKQVEASIRTTRAVG